MHQAVVPLHCLAVAPEQVHLVVEPVYFQLGAHLLAVGPGQVHFVVEAVHHLQALVHL